MAARKVWPSADDQIESYKLQFTLAKEMMDWDRRNKLPPSYTLEDAKERRSKRNIYVSYLHGKGWDGSMWNWDATWDKLLIENVKSLSKYFQIRKFFRKQKIEMTWPEVSGKKIAKIDIMAKIYLALENDDYIGVSFRQNTISIWWK